MRKEEILQALRRAGEGFVSDETLCGQLKVSRQEVRESISELKKNGYQIVSAPDRGYHLACADGRMYAADILSRLPADCLCRKVECVDEVDSTNTRMKQAAEAGEKAGMLLVSDRQTAGRGRRGRVWSSNPGNNIYMTLLLRPAIPPAKVSGLTLLAALALTDALREKFSVEAQIKWPNDVVIGGKKICGILTEMSSEQDFVRYVVVGIGINVNEEVFGPELEETATSLYLQCGKKFDRNVLAAAVVENLCSYYGRFEERQDLSDFVEAYNRILANRDRQVAIYYGMAEDAGKSEVETGIAKGIDREGALVVAIDGKKKRIVSGEVSIRGMHGYL